MVAGGLSYTELHAILVKHGYKVESDEFWETHNRIYFKKSDEPVVILQFKSHYTFSFIVKFLTSLEIEPPGHCQKMYDYFIEQLKKYNTDSPE
jgi:hypothetical protein